MKIRITIHGIQLRDDNDVLIDEQRFDPTASEEERTEWARKMVEGLRERGYQLDPGCLLS